VLAGGLAGSAAIVALVLLIPLLSVPQLPDYEFTLEGTTAMRGTSPPDASPVLLTAGNRFELILRPATALEEPVEARVWLLRGDGDARALPASPARQLRGAVLISGEVGTDWPIAAGDGLLLVVVGYPQALPDVGVLRRRLGDSRRSVSGRGWQAWRLPVRIE
jgi:hypothetical protein